MSAGPVAAVVFDHGGVLTPGGRPGSSEKVYAQMMELHEPVKVSDLRDRLKRGQMTSAEFVAAVNARYPHAPKLLDSSVWDARYAELTPDGFAYAAAAACRKAGLITGILSNITPEMAIRMRRDGWYHGFSPVLLSCEIGAAKSDPEAYAAVEDSLPWVAPGEILFLDDQEKHVAAARRRGWQAFRVDSTNQMVDYVIGILRNQK